MEIIMINFKRVHVKKETRTLKHTDFSWDYYLDYVGRYNGDKLIGISKHERKYFDTSNGIKGGLYMNNINKFSNAYQKAKKILETA